MRSPTNGGWSFAFDPLLDPRNAPAFWRPDATPVVLTLNPATEPGAAPPLSLDHLEPVCTASLSPDEQYLVADDDFGRHRLLLRRPNSAQPLALNLPVDDAIALRLDAAARLTRGGSVSALCFHPTEQQRSRMALMLQILDAEDAAMPTRAIAEELIYPHMRSLHGAAWKASAERRRTHRLRQEAVRIRDHGIADLLHGRLRPPG